MLLVYAGLSQIPQNVLQKYDDLGWEIVLSNDNLKKKHQVEGEPVGICSYIDKCIEVTSLAENSWFFDDTIIHEMGHFVESAVGGNNTNNWARFKKTWKSLYNKTKAKGSGSYSLQTNSLLENLSDVYYREYAFEGEEEFFAESYVLYVEYPEKFKAAYPEVYAFVDEYVSKLSK